LLRRNPNAGGGAEKVAKRYAAGFGGEARVTLVTAGTTQDGMLIGGLKGSSWRKSLRFAKDAHKLTNRTDATVFSMERVYECDLYRAGDGVHAHWVKLKYGASPKKWLNPLNWVSTHLERATIASAKVVIANSTMVAEQIKQYYPQHAGKVRIINNGFDPSIYKPSPTPKGELRQKLHTNADARWLVFAGSGWDRKGLAEAIEVLATLRKTENWQLHVLGNGKPQRYQSLMSSKGVSGAVHFHGFVEDVASWYQTADFMILPTLYDPFANSTLEALACGCPVITTNTNGASEVVRHKETGFILSQGKEHDRLIQWIQSGDVAASETVVASVAHLTAEAETAKILAAIKEVQS